MGMKIKFFILPLLIVLLPLRVISQVNSGANNQNQIDREFIYIVVEKGQTLYSLSRQHNIPQDSLLYFNPQLKDGLKKDMQLRIPVAKIPAGAILHEVKSGETIYGISRSYNLTVDELTQQNPIILNGLNVGMKLTIFPKPKAVPVEVPPKKIDDNPSDSLVKIKKSDCIIDSITRAEVYKIGLILPFSSGRGILASRSRTGLEFYGGCAIAFDELEKEGYNLEVELFDSQRDTAAIENLANNPALLQKDLIIGPLYASEFRQIAEISATQNIFTVTPFSTSLALVSNSPHVCKVSADAEMQLTALCDYLKTGNSNSNFIIVRNTKESDKQLADALTSRIKSFPASSNITCIEVDNSSFEKVSATLNKNKKNIVFFPSTDQAEVIEFCANLVKEAKGNDVTLAGLNEWSDFEKLDQDHLNELKFIYASTNFIDYDRYQSIDFQKKYKAKYNSDPGNYSYLGYDIMLYFGRSVAQIKRNPDCITQMQPYCGLGTCLKFQRRSTKGGIENVSLPIIQIKEYFYMKVN
jgi:ABC-type branched-subunit amino acid transport system substrate-binding protein